MSNDKTPQLDGNKRKIEHLLEENRRVEPTPFVPTDDADRDAPEYRHNLAANPEKLNFDQKVYMFPESYNALRREISSNWPNLWAGVQWLMAYDAFGFVEAMNAATGLHIQFDTEKVGWICDQYLTKLRQMRGLSK